MGVHIDVDPGIPRCRHSGDNSHSVSNDKTRVCGLWDARPVVVMAQRAVDWRLAAGQLNTVCVCWHAGPTLYMYSNYLDGCKWVIISTGTDRPG